MPEEGRAEPAKSRGGLGHQIGLESGSSRISCWLGDLGALGVKSGLVGLSGTTMQ